MAPEMWEKTETTTKTKPARKPPQTSSAAGAHPCPSHPPLSSVTTVLVAAQVVLKEHTLPVPALEGQDFIGGTAELDILANSEGISWAGAGATQGTFPHSCWGKDMFVPVQPCCHSANARRIEWCPGSSAFEPRCVDRLNHLPPPLGQPGFQEGQCAPPPQSCQQHLRRPWSTNRRERQKNRWGPLWPTPGNQDRILTSFSIAMAKSTLMSHHYPSNNQLNPEP